MMAEYKSPRTIAKEAINKVESFKKRDIQLPSDNILIALKAVFEFSDSINERLTDTCHQNNLWDGS